MCFICFANLRLDLAEVRLRRCQHVLLVLQMPGKHRDLACNVRHPPKLLRRSVEQEKAAAFRRLMLERRGSVRTRSLCALTCTSTSRLQGTSSGRTIEGIVLTSIFVFWRSIQLFAHSTLGSPGGLRQTIFGEQGRRWPQLRGQALAQGFPSRM